MRFFCISASGISQLFRLVATYVITLSMLLIAVFALLRLISSVEEIIEVTSRLLLLLRLHRALFLFKVVFVIIFFNLFRLDATACYFVGP